MSDDPALVLKLLFQIAPAQIERDVAEGERDFQRLMEDGGLPEDSGRDDPKAAARHYHTQMVRASVMRSRASLQEDAKLYFAAMAASSIAEEAVVVANEQGQLADLGLRIDEIQKREGIPQEELWETGEGPEDYQKLCSESEELFARVYDTVFTTMLRRYRLDNVAELYENDRDKFELMWERGRSSLLEDGSEK